LYGVLFGVRVRDARVHVGPQARDRVIGREFPPREREGPNPGVGVVTRPALALGALFFVVVSLRRPGVWPLHRVLGLPRGHHRP
jgi:hypothetical protein